MAYVYSLVNSLQNTEMVGDQECVALVKKYAHLGATATWRQGKKVFGDMSIPRGAAIATFVHGKYPASGAGCVVMVHTLMPVITLKPFM